MTMYKVSIPQAIRLESHTTFRVTLTNPEDESWEVSHRYSEFLILHEKLEKVFSVVSTYGFPGKKLFNKEKEFVEIRRQQLEQYFIKVFENVNLVNNALVRDFFGLKDVCPDPTKDIEIKEKKEEKGRTSSSPSKRTISAVPQKPLFVDSIEESVFTQLSTRLSGFCNSAKLNSDWKVLSSLIYKSLYPKAVSQLRAHLISVLKAGAVFEELSAKKPVRWAVRLSANEYEIKSGVMNKGDTEIPSAENLPHALSVLSVTSLLCGVEIPVIAKMKKPGNKQYSLALTIRDDAVGLQNLSHFKTGLVAENEETWRDWLDGLRVLLKNEKWTTHAVNSVSDLIYHDVIARMAGFSNEDAQQIVETQPPDEPALPNTFAAALAVTALAEE
eukprot:GCRY01002559.1.p1 GENE.GCRY01002559.1~~GCRY01002559.1.p1  ORF type:complete len:386 (-),score=69.31 GCRY01002559.1:370-1527(-)